MSNTLIDATPQVMVGLGTMTYTIPANGDGIYNVKFQATMNAAPITGDGAGSGTGIGAGSGGGAGYNGFSAGGHGVGYGGAGQGFGPTDGYQQPPYSGSNETTSPAISSTLSVVVNDNGAPIFTAPVIGQAQSAVQFKTSFLAVAGHIITVVVSSGDGLLNSIKSSTSIEKGIF
jgi:hypothetical protein